MRRDDSEDERIGRSLANMFMAGIAFGIGVSLLIFEVGYSGSPHECHCDKRHEQDAADAQEQRP